MNAFRHFLKLAVWGLCGVHGVFALTLFRNESVNAFWIVIASVCTFAIATASIPRG